MKKNPMNLILCILWLIVLVMDIVSAASGSGQPTWFNMILAHLCLVFAYFHLYLKDNFH